MKFLYHFHFHSLLKARLQIKRIGPIVFRKKNDHEQCRYEYIIIGRDQFYFAEKHRFYQKVSSDII